MKKSISIAVLVLIIASCSSNKIYLDANNNRITSEQFKAIEKNKAHIIKVKKDTVTYKGIFRKHVAHLDSIQHIQIKIFLTKIIGPGFNENKNTLIHLYRKNKDIKKATKYERYWSVIANNKQTLQAFLIGIKNSEVKTNKKKHIYLDPYDLLNNLFFLNSPFDINHIYLKPSGEVYIYYGQKDILWPLDWSM